MKLYSFLFEQEEVKPTKKFTSYTAPDFALFVDDEKSLILIHTDSLLNYLKTPSDQVPVYDICAGMIECDERGNDCLGSLQVSFAVASPKWKGAGTTLYALASDYFGAPLTSDRRHSSSTAAKEMWAKIEQNPEWKKAGEGLDNYAQVSSGKMYMDIQGTYPNRTAEPRTKQVKGFFKNVVGAMKSIAGDASETEPRTRETIDDCPLPAKKGDVTNPERMAELVGTANAYRYVGPLKAEPLVAQGEKLLRQTADPRTNPKYLEVDQLIVDMAEKLFNTRYQGSETTR